jgi:hypothetical protein
MTRIAIPSSIAQRAFTAAGDISRITSTLSGTSTFQALCAAEQARVRVMNEMRALAPEIRRLKAEARAVEKQRERDGFAIPRVGAA